MLPVASKARNWVSGVFRGWWVLVTCMAVQVLVSSFTMQSFGTYIAVMKDEFGWTATQFSVAFAILQASGGFIGPLIGWLVYRFGGRYTIRVGLVIFAAGLCLMSTVESLFVLYLSVSVMALGAALAGFLPLNTIAVQWFERWRSTALALMQTGISLAGFTVPLIAWSLITYGWRATAMASSLIVLLLGLPLTWLIGNKPEDYGLEPDGGASRRQNARVALNPARDITANEALQTRAFWFISFGHGLALMLVFAVLAHLVIYLNGERGLSLQLAGTVFAIMTSASIVGQLSGGFLGDKFNKRLLAIVAMFGHAIGLLLLAYGSGLATIILAVIIHGLAWGLRGPIMQSIRADYFGRSHFSTIMGYSSVIVTLGILFGPLSAGILADVFGSYRIGFTLLAGLAVLGSIFFVFATPPQLDRLAPKTGSS